MIPRISAKFETTLAIKVDIGDEGGTLTSVTDSEGNALPNGTYGFTIDEGNSDFEYIECTITGTAITNVKSYSVTNLTETTGFTKSHRAGAEVKITDYTILGKLTGIFRGTVGMDASTPIFYESSPTLSNPYNLATVEYVLSVVTGGSVTFNSNIIAGVAGEAISSGDWVYFKESDGLWYITDANLEETCINVKLGKALGDATTGNAIASGVFIGGLETTGTYVAGTKYYLSNTAGATSTSAGENEVLLGIGDDNGDLVFLNLYDPEAVTKKEKDALQGTQGTPNTDNKFVTADNVSFAEVSQSQTTDNISIEVGQSDATTNKVKIAQSFNPTRSKIRGIKLKTTEFTGTPTGTITVSIQEDASGEPSGTDLVSKTNSYILADENQEVYFKFASEYSIDTSNGDPYWIVVTSSTSDNSNLYQFSANSAGGYSDGALKYNNTTDGWVTISGYDLYFKVIDGLDGQIISGTSPKEIFNQLGISFDKRHSISFIDNSNIRNSKSASTVDGSVVVLCVNAGSDNDLFRLEKSKFGSYEITHFENGGVNANSGLALMCSPVIYGDYVYVYYRDGSNVLKCKRFDIADLGNGTDMTISNVTYSSDNMFAWTDNVYMYVMPSSGATGQNTVYKYSVSGTTLTVVGSQTASTSLYTSLGYYGSLFSDGNNIWYLTNTGNNLYVRKLNNIFATSITSSTIGDLYTATSEEAYKVGIVPEKTPLDSRFIAMNIDDDYMYIGYTGHPLSDDGTNITYGIQMIPYIKP